MTSATTIEPMFLRLPAVLRMVPVSKSTWWNGVKLGVYPSPIRLSARTTAWRRQDILDLCERLGEPRS
jgi:prophage regulatory protein